MIKILAVTKEVYYKRCQHCDQKMYVEIDLDKRGLQVGFTCLCLWNGEPDYLGDLTCHAPRTSKFRMPFSLYCGGCNRLHRFHTFKKTDIEIL